MTQIWAFIGMAMNHLGMKSQAECFDGLYVHFIGAPPLADVANKENATNTPSGIISHNKATAIL